MKLKVCFVGIGSIAKRHIRNLTRMCSEENIQLIIDAVSRDGKRKEPQIVSLIRKFYSDVAQMEDEYDAVFITNPTEYHIDTLNCVTPYGKNFFVEKPISSIRQIEQAVSYQKKENSVYYVACPLRYHAVIQYIRKNVDIKDVISVRSISSSYLPDWRPGIDYRNTYSAQKSLGGGVAIDLIHEWDYLTFLFGMPQKVCYMFGKKSELEIDCEDYAVYIAEYADKVVELHLDYFGRNTIREMMLFTKEDTIVCDLVNSTVKYLKSGKNVSFQQERDDYQMRELKHFLKMIQGKAEQDSTIEHAVQVLQLTQGRISV